MKSCNDKIKITLVNYYPEERFLFRGFLIRRNGKEGILDVEEKSLLSCDYDNIVIVQYDSLLDIPRYFTHDNSFESFEYSACNAVGNRYAFLCKFSGRWGFLDDGFHIIVPFEYEDIKVLSYIQDLMCFAVKSDGKWGLFKNGRLEIACIYEEIESLEAKDGKYYKVKENGLYGVVNSAGKTIVPCNYDYVNKWSKVLLRVRSAGKWGLYQMDGTPALPCLYDSINVNKVQAVVKLKNQYGMWVKTDAWKLFIPCEFDNIEHLSATVCFNGLSMDYPSVVNRKKKQGLYVLVNNKPLKLVPTEYDRVCKHRDGYIVLVKDNSGVPLLEYLKTKAVEID